MPIEFHCNHCNNLVRAQDDAGGRKGKCPYCKLGVYIPTPPDQIEILDFAEDDEDWKDEKKRLKAEAGKLDHALLDERKIADDVGATDAPAEPAMRIPGESSPDAGAHPARKGVEARVVDYLVAMKSSELERAETLVKQIAPDADRAKSFAQEISMDPVPPPELADVPPAVLRGFIKSLLSRL